MANLFQLFSQGEDQRLRTGGLGIGLSLVKQLVELLERCRKHSLSVLVPMGQEIAATPLQIIAAYAQSARQGTVASSQRVLDAIRAVVGEEIGPFL
jgi:cell division protein FtsI/penicillin-binding protein 2